MNEHGIMEEATFLWGFRPKLFPWSRCDHLFDLPLGWRLFLLLRWCFSIYNLIG